MTFLFTKAFVPVSSICKVWCPSCNGRCESFWQFRDRIGWRCFWGYSKRCIHWGANHQIWHRFDYICNLYLYLFIYFVVHSIASLPSVYSASWNLLFFLSTWQTLIGWVYRLLQCNTQAKRCSKNLCMWINEPPVTWGPHFQIKLITPAI